MKVPTGRTLGWLGGAAALSAAALTLVGTTLAGNASEGSSSKATATKAKIALFTAVVANPYDSALNRGVEQEAKKLGASLTIFDGAFDPSKQVAQCTAALGSKKYNVFLIKPVAGPTMINCARRALAAGIKVVATDTPIGPKYQLETQVPGVAMAPISMPQSAGVALGKLAARACGSTNPCEVAFVHGPAIFTFSKIVTDSALAELKKHKNVKVVFKASGDYVPAKAIAAANQAVIKNPGLDVLLIDDDLGGIGAIKSLKQKGKFPAIKVVGGGGTHVGKASIAKGELYGTYALYPETVGRHAVRIGIGEVNGKPGPKKGRDASFLKPVNPVITKANVARFQPEWG